MRRSSVRLRLWAQLLTPVRIAPCGGFVFYPSSIFSIEWHTSGTLNHKSWQHIFAQAGISLVPLSHSLNSQKVYETLFQCAASVPLNQCNQSITRKMMTLYQQNIALHMRCCLILLSFVICCRIIQEIIP